MKRIKIISSITAVLLTVLIAVAADHIDAPAVAGGSSDITDFYAFQGQNSDNLVFVANLQGLLSPMATSGASFDESTLIEFNIDNDGDNVEDLVIQAVPRDGMMYFFGPVAPTAPGLNSMIESAASTTGMVEITTYGEEAVVASNGGISYFAGPRDDPFFMDFAQYTEIIGGNATAFNNPGSDTFAGTNVLSIVVEVPKSMLGTGASINTWVESKTKQ